MKRRLGYFVLLLVYFAAFGLFYYRYVPLVEFFQLALVPILLAVFLLAAWNVERGLVFFVFAFPLVNNLPYFFGIYGHIPHAPTALVLFLAFFPGFLVNRFFVVGESGGRVRPHPVFRPMAFFAAVVIVSGVITFHRYANFFPFLADGIYDIPVNVNLVSAGGAIMSDVFNLLNYLTGMGFFAILFFTVRSEKTMRRLLLALSVATGISLVFALVQRYHSISLGNMPFWVEIGQLNGTLKDPNSFGGFLAAVCPLFLGMFFWSRRKGRAVGMVFAAALMALSLFIFPSIGSRSALLALVVSGVVFFALALPGLRPFLRRKTLPVAVSILVVLLVVFGFVISARQSNLHQRMRSSLEVFTGKTTPDAFFNLRLSLWRAAWEMMRDYPLTGVGMGAYIVEAPNYFELLGLPTEAADSALNHLWQVGSETGFIGLALVIWLLVEIIKQMKRSLRRLRPGDDNRFILAGAVAAAASFFTSFLFHTFVGSYELKYTFWLLIGIVFLVERFVGNENGVEGVDNGAGERGMFGRRFWAAALVLALVFGAVHLWNSTHSLSIKSTAERFGFKQNFGFYEEKKTGDGREFRWTRGYGGVTVTVEKPRLVIPLHASHPDINKKPVGVKIYLVRELFRQKKLIDEITLVNNHWIDHELNLSEAVGEEVILLFKVSRTWNPLKWQGTPDPRNLGVALGNIVFKEAE